jgi:hypothetical protein
MRGAGARASQFSMGRFGLTLETANWLTAWVKPTLQTFLCLPAENSLLARPDW